MNWTKDWGQTSRSLDRFDSFLSAVLIPKDYDSKKSPCEMNHLGHYLTVLSTWLLSTKQLAMWALTLKESVPPDLCRASMFVWSNVDKRINVNLWLSQLGTGSLILVAICYFCFPQPFKDPKMSEDATTLCLRLHWKKPTCRLPSWVLFLVPLQIKESLIGFQVGVFVDASWVYLRNHSNMFLRFLGNWPISKP